MHVAVACSAHAVHQWLGRFDVVVVGPGLGREQAIQDAVRKVGIRSEVFRHGIFLVFGLK